MIKLAAAAALTLGLATVAHAGLSTQPSTEFPPSPGSQAAPAAEKPVRPAIRHAEVRTFSPVTQTDADPQPESGRPAPRVIDLPRSDAPSQGGYVAAPAGAPQPERVARISPASAVQAPAATEAPAVRPEPAQIAPPRRAERAAPEGRPAGYRTASWNGGRGATWKAGKNDYGFEGSFGGCRFAGFSGPRGFTLDRTCR
ncbi:hypothetical protein [Methylobacterium sp. WSM2598]|uniref:hypothetical protein n=1 Tax=Methylobacterium sp. WSM2598 TaxID=398261 RepID=UPI0003AAD20B|nr:hypothetical protein [Methylobacterium sp. WSM2598]